jgi:hypothetical protein
MAFDVSILILELDGITPVEDATVKLLSASATHIGQTNEDGTVFFNVSPNQFILSVTKSGYGFAPQQLNVVADTTLTVYPASTNVLSKDIPTATQIWRDSGLPVDTFSFITEDDAIEWIATTILPETEAYVAAKLNQATLPYNYPLSNTVISQVFQGQNWTSVSMIVSGWDTARLHAIRFLALYRLFLLADSLKKEYLNKAEAFRRAGEDSLNTLLLSLKQTVGQASSGGRKFGLLLLKLPKSKNRNLNEFEL